VTPRLWNIGNKLERDLSECRLYSACCFALPGCLRSREKPSPKFHEKSFPCRHPEKRAEVCSLCNGGHSDGLRTPSEKLIRWSNKTDSTRKQRYASLAIDLPISGAPKIGIVNSFMLAASRDDSPRDKTPPAKTRPADAGRDRKNEPRLSPSAQIPLDSEKLTKWLIY